MIRLERQRLPYVGFEIIDRERGRHRTFELRRASEIRRIQIVGVRIGGIDGYCPLREPGSFFIRGTPFGVLLIGIPKIQIQIRQADERMGVRGCRCMVGEESL